MDMGPDEIWAEVIVPWLEERQEMALARLGSPDFLAEDKRWEVDRRIADETFSMVFQSLLNYWVQDKELWEVLHTEEVAARLITHPHTGKVLTSHDGRPVVYAGGMDLILRYRENGNVWLFEHKSTADRNLSKYCQKTDFDPQTRGYCWILEDPLESVSFPSYNVQGVVLNVARKKVPYVPQITKMNKLESRKTMDTTASVYAAAVVSNGFELSDYQEMIDSLENNQFVARKKVQYSRADLEDFHWELWEHCSQILAAEEQSYWPRQTALCMPKGSYTCEFSQICKPCSTKTEDLYTIRGMRHVELTGTLAEIV
jgi:hypothetical protein